MSRPEKQIKIEAPRRLVVVEDEHLVAEGIAGMLRELSYEVVAICPSGEEALECCRQQNPDLVLMDIRLPGMTGLEAAEVIFGDMDIPVIIVSAYSDPEYARTSANIGIFGYLLKPLNQDDLRTTLTVAWGQYRAYRENLNEIERLKKLLEDRKIVEKAKWVLVDRMGISEEQALRRLQKKARDNRKPLVDIAQNVLENRDLFSSDV